MNELKTGSANAEIQSKLLWENPNPNSGFNAQTVTLSESLADYQGVLIFYKNGSDSGYFGYYVDRHVHDNNNQKIFMARAGSDWNIGRREVTPNFNSNTVQFTNYSLNNPPYLRPIKIYGIKNDVLSN